MINELTSAHSLVHRQGKAYNGIDNLSQQYILTDNLAFKNDLSNIGEIVSLKKLHPKIELK
jgi:hypothetical protein